jgi:hypothetical protein
MLYFVIGYLPRLLDGSLAEDFLWPKRQILKVLGEFRRVASETGAFPHLYTAACGLEEVLTARWRALHGADILAIRPFPALAAP